MAVIERQVAAGNDDAHEADDGTNFARGNVVVRWDANTTAANRYNGGHLFENITLPSDATVDANTYLSVVFSASDRDSPDVDIHAEDVDDAVDFLSDADVTSRVRTTASVNWSATDQGTGSHIDSPSITTVIDEIQARGAASGYNICILADGSNLTPPENGCRTVAYNGTPADAAILHIEYTPAEPPISTIGFITAPKEAFSKVSYEVWLTDDRGVRIAQLTTFKTLEASRVVNQAGYFEITMPSSFDTNLIQPDRMVQLWRAPRGGRLKLWRVYFVRRWTFAKPDGALVTSFGGPDVLDLMRRRIVAAYTGLAQASKTDFADDMMKEVVTQSIADSIPATTAGTRLWNDLSIATDLGLGPTITKSFPFDKLLTGSGQGVLAVLAKAAREAGTEVFFDIVPDVVSSNSISFQFQTFTGQPGADQTTRVVFEDDKNMSDPELEYDYTEEENYIYAGGQGEESERDVQQVSDSTRYSVSQWARIEGFADSRNQTGDGVREAGRDRLNAGRPKIRFSAVPSDVRGTRFGRDWDFGDKVKAKFLNIEFDTIIRAVTLSVDDSGRESIAARLDFES